MPALFGDSISRSSWLPEAEDLRVEEWIGLTQEQLDLGQFFHAYDLAAAGLRKHSASQTLRLMAAQALVRTGALDEALSILEPICQSAKLSEATLHDLYGALRHTIERVGSDEGAVPSAESLGALSEFARQVIQAARVSDQGSAASEEGLGLLASVYKEQWRRTDGSEGCIRARDAYLRAFAATGGYWTGINAATLSWIAGEREMAERLARRVLTLCGGLRLENAEPEERYWLLATEGEANLLLGEVNAAWDAYEAAVQIAGTRYRYVVSSRRQLHLLREHGFAVPEELLNTLHAPAMVVFTGHMLDQAGRREPRFPPELAEPVRFAIDRQLEALDARIGYSSAACGADLVFVEAMLDRGSEINIVLPFACEDFIRLSVAFAGQRWVARFHRALRLATSVKYVTEEKHLGDDALFGFSGQILNGYAALRAHTLDVEPHMVALWDGVANDLVGGTAYQVAHWPWRDRLHIIDIDVVRRAAEGGRRDTPAAEDAVVPRAVIAETPAARCSRVVRTMLFVDVVRYSALQEEHTPLFMYEFLERIAQQLRDVAQPPLHVNTWGDAIFAVMDRAAPMADYALALQEAVCRTNWADLGLPAQLSVRIALHAGPVFEAPDPITGRTNYYGAHVNRAARIEPVTVPGCVYASEQFAALLEVERAQAEVGGNAALDAIRCEYVGTLSLAKGFGAQPVYHIRRSAGRRGGSSTMG